MGFWAWYNKRVTESLLVTAVILYLQIPHTLTAGECFFFDTNYFIHVHPVLDFMLYGIDLLEMIPLVAITMTLYARFKASNSSS
jgi:hypothetical protein